jgi:hypothetical protein
LLERNLRAPPGRVAQPRGVTAEHGNVSRPEPLRVGLDGDAGSRHSDEELDDPRHPYGLPGRDVVDVRRDGRVEQEPVSAADIAHIHEVTLDFEVADAKRASACEL